MAVNAAQDNDPLARLIDQIMKDQTREYKLEKLFILDDDVIDALELGQLTRIRGVTLDARQRNRLINAVEGLSIKSFTTAQDVEDQGGVAELTPAAQERRRADAQTKLARDSQRQTQEAQSGKVRKPRSSLGIKLQAFRLWRYVFVMAIAICLVGVAFLFLFHSFSTPMRELFELAFLVVIVSTATTYFGPFTIPPMVFGAILYLVYIGLLMPWEGYDKYDISGAGFYALLIDSAIVGAAGTLLGVACWQWYWYRKTLGPAKKRKAKELQEEMYRKSDAREVTALPATATIIVSFTVALIIVTILNVQPWVLFPVNLGINALGLIASIFFLWEYGFWPNRHTTENFDRSVETEPQADMLDEEEAHDQEDN
jgi:hypothetical protein